MVAAMRHQWFLCSNKFYALWDPVQTVLRVKENRQILLLWGQVMYKISGFFFFFFLVLALYFFHCRVFVIHKNRSCWGWIRSQQLFWAKVQEWWVNSIYLYTGSKETHLCHHITKHLWNPFFGTPCLVCIYFSFSTKKLSIQEGEIVMYLWGSPSSTSLED